MSNLLGSRLLGSLIVFQTQHIRYNLSMFINLLILFTERENTNYNEVEWRRKHFSIQLKLCRTHITLALDFLMYFLALTAPLYL